MIYANGKSETKLIWQLLAIVQLNINNNSRHSYSCAHTHTRIYLYMQPAKQIETI